MASNSNNRLARRVQAYLESSGLSGRALSLKAGRSTSFVKHILNGDSRSNTLENLGALAKAMGMTLTELLADDTVQGHTPDGAIDDRVKRFSVARRAHWGDDIASAAAALGVDVGKLLEYETGAVEVPKDFLWQFSCISGYPPTWIENGSFADMSGNRAARIAGIAPDLVPLLED